MRTSRFRRVAGRWLVLVSLVCAGPTPVGAQQRPWAELELLVKPDKQVYRLGDTAVLNICVKNVSERTVTIPSVLDLGLSVRPTFADGTWIPGNFGGSHLPLPGLVPKREAYPFASLAKGYMVCMESAPEKLKDWKLTQPGRYGFEAWYRQPYSPGEVEKLFGVVLWWGEPLHTRVEIRVVR